MRTLFAPDDDTTGEFLKFIGGAQSSITMLIYGYHLPALSDILIAKHKAGVRVRIILDHSQEAGKAEGVEVQRLIDAGVPILIGTSPEHGQILHTKMTVVDGEHVEDGSWNYSTSAGFQSNTMHFAEHAPDYAKAFLEHWHRIWGFVYYHQQLYQKPGEREASDDTTLSAADTVTAPSPKAGKAA